jgi:iron complex outermembrane receptor protein
MMEARSQNSLSDVIKQAPNVILEPATPAFGPAIFASIRGLGQTDFNPALEPGVGFYIDDVYYPRLTGANFDLLDVERVEVLRGPQGTLTGRNSEGGAIKFISRKPTGEGDGYVQGTYGSRDRINLRAAADFKITETLFGRLSGTFADQDGYVKNLDFGCANPGGGVPPATPLSDSCVVSKHGDVGYKAIRGILRFVPTDAIDLMISADYHDEERHQGPEVLLYADNTANPNVEAAPGVPFDSRFICGPYCNYATYDGAGGGWVDFAGFFGGDGFPVADIEIDPMLRFESWNVSANLSVDLSDRINVTSITGYREWNTYFGVDNDLSPSPLGQGVNQLDHWFFSQELRLNANLSDFLDLTIGGYYSDERTTYFTLQDIRYTPFPLQFVGNDPVNTDSKAVFATLFIKPTEDLTLTLGGRYTDEHKDYTFTRLFTDLSGPHWFLGALDGVQGVYDGDRIDYRVSLDYRFSPEILAYATVSTGFKGGGIGPRPFFPTQAVGFNPEKVRTYEAGLKTDLIDGVRLNLTGFYNDFTDAQLTLLTCDAFSPFPGAPCALPQNAGDATQKGFEAELLATPIEGLIIDGAASYIDYEWDCVNPAVVGLADGPCSSDPMVVSRLADQQNGWKWSFGAQYEANLGDHGTLTPRFDVTHQPRLPGNVLEPAAGSPGDLLGRVPGYTLANARLTWRNADEDLSIAFEVTNLTDNYYFNAKFDLTGVAPGNPIGGSPGRPREWAITVKKEF